MARGEGRTVSAAEPAADPSPPMLVTIGRLMALIGGLKGPGYRLRLIAAVLLTLLGKVLAVFSPLVLADGINALSAGDASGALPMFLGLAGFWAGLRFASDGALDVSFREVAYNHEALAQQMLREGLPAEFVETIRTGWWTTCLENVPSRERMRALAAAK